MKELFGVESKTHLYSLSVLEETMKFDTRILWGRKLETWCAIPDPSIIHPQTQSLSPKHTPWTSCNVYFLRESKTITRSIPEWVTYCPCSQNSTGKSRWGHVTQLLQRTLVHFLSTHFSFLSLATAWDHYEFLRSDHMLQQMRKQIMNSTDHDKNCQDPHSGWLMVLSLSVGKYWQISVSGANMAIRHG